MATDSVGPGDHRVDLVVVSYFNPADVLGGAERYAWAEAELLSASRRVMFVSASPPVPGSDVPQLRLGSWTRRLYQPPGPRRNPFKLAALHLLNLFNPAVFVESLRAFRRLRPEVVHTHNLVALSPAIWLSARLSGATVLHTHQDLWLLCERATMTDAEGRPCNESQLTCVGCRALRPVKRLFIRGVAVEVFSSGWLRGRLGRRGPLVRSFSTSSVRMGPREPASTPTVAYIGALTPHKLGPLVEAFRTAASSLPGARLVIAGAGQLEDRMRKAAEEGPNIVYLGQIDSETRDEVLREAAALVIPSTCAENSPLVFFEALASGVPVIASDLGGITELEAFGNVLLVPPGDADALARALTELLRDRARLAEFRAQALERRGDALPERFVREMESLLGGLGAGHPEGDSPSNR